MKTNVRWMIRGDMVGVLRIESESFDRPWTEQVFLDLLRQRNCIGEVAERDGEIVGFQIYELRKGEIELLNLAVCPRHRNQGVGSSMVRKRIDKCESQRRDIIEVMVRESNLAGQMFFKSQGFRCVEILHDAYDDVIEDGYIFQYAVSDAARQIGLLGDRLRNRISEI